MLIHHLCSGTREDHMAITIFQSTAPSECRSERMSAPIPANCSGLANTGVPAKACGIERAGSQGEAATGFASPRSISLAVKRSPFFKLAMMLTGLMSRCTSPCSSIRGQTRSDLAHYFQSDFWLKSSAFDKMPKRLPFHKLHCIEVAVAALL